MTPRRPRTAVIPAAGLGTRFLPATKAQPKGMLTVIDKPAIQYVVEEAVAAGLDDIVMVVSPGNRALQEHFGRSTDLERALGAAGKTAALATVRAIAELAQVTFVVQEQPLGLGHAVAMARVHVGDESFAVLLGDDLFDPRSHLLGDMLDTQAQHGGSVIALKEVGPAEIGLYGCAGVEPVDGHVARITEIVEKPSAEAAPSNLAVMGRYVFTASIFDALDKVAPGSGGEIQLTDAVQLLLAREPVFGWTFARGRFDAGNKLDFLRATVEFALERSDLGEDFRALLFDVVDRERGTQPPPP